MEKRTVQKRNNRSDTNSKSNMPQTPAYKKQAEVLHGSPHTQAAELDCFRVGMEEITRKFRFKVDNAMDKADQAARKGRRCKIVSKQSEKTVQHHRKLAKKVKANVENTFEYRLLKLVHRVIAVASNATKSAGKCALEYKKLAEAHVKTAHVVLNVTKKLKAVFHRASLPTASLEKAFPLPTTMTPRMP